MVEMCVMKHCPSCETDLPRTYFGLNSGRSDGLQSYCFECRSARARTSRRTCAIPEYVYDPQQGRARVAVARALKAGRIYKSPRCLDCGSPYRKLEGHHHLGYAREHWLDVVWLCRSCHMVRHQRNAG